MMSIVYGQLSRRNLLKYLGNSVLFLPVMRTFNETQVFGADVAPRRAVFFYFPSGTIEGEFHPAAGNLGTLPSMTKPLEKVKSDILMIRNSIYATGGSHQGGMQYALTGVPDNGDGAPSIDYYLGEKFKGSIPVLRLGVRSRFEGGDIPQSCSFIAKGVLGVRTDNPAKAFQDVFGGSAPTTPGGSTPVATSGLVYQSKKSLLDCNLQELQSLQKKLGSVEKEKLDFHITSIRELERRLDLLNSGTSGSGDSGTSGQCTRKVNMTKTFDPNDNAYDASYKSVENYDAVADMQCEIAIQALACRVTNVVLLQQGFSVFEMTFSGGQPAKGGKGHHSNSHYNAEGNKADHIADQQYMMTKFANLIEGMGKIKEGDKSLLFNSSIMAFSELGDSNDHSMKNVPTIIAGQGGGYFKTGRCVDAGGLAHSKTLVSIFESFGLMNQTIGSEKSGPMPGLTG